MTTASVSRPVLAFVGGFLGAGKTTLILKAAEILYTRGARSAVIVNDQDAGLVDTSHVASLGFAAREITRGCLCCQFSDLVDAAGQLRQHGPDVIFAEPVGSCVDLAATVLQPMLAFHRETFLIAPLTVVVDPFQVQRLERGELPQETEFLMRHQLEEADLICATKQDLYAGVALQTTIAFRVSGATGEGVEQWLDALMRFERVPGSRLLDIDYEQYAAAEAGLAWLNLHADLRLNVPRSPALVVGPLLDGLKDELGQHGISIAHLKVFDRAATGWVRASVTGSGWEPNVAGDVMADAAHEHEIVINVRALGEPEDVKRIALEELDRLKAELTVRHVSAFRPAAPVPEHRFTKPDASQ